MPAVAPAAGTPQRLGKYELLLPLAAGGMARIYIGRSQGIGSFERHVVLKLITPERANDHTAVQMFLDEARLAACLNHQNVAQVFEVGEEGGIHYLAMEYVHGQDLRALLAKAGGQGTRIPLDLALTVVAGAAAGLNHAHDRRGPDGLPLGIVHRDVSPSNIMIGYDGAVKLLDFGIAKATSRSVETQSGIIKGKFAYMAPEQCRGRDVDKRSDVFSLGIILYEITTQHRCFRADSDFDTMHRIVTGDVVRPTRLVQGYPPALEAIVLKALAVDASQRYQSAGLLLEAIESFAVAARMSLSTMTLGRFMRDMFGEQPEPWLQANRHQSQPVNKENTISSTDGQGSESRPAAPAIAPAAPASSGVPSQEAAAFDSTGIASQTVLDLPRGGGGEEADREEARKAEWNARSYPSATPSLASSETLPPDANVRQYPRVPTPPPGAVRPTPPSVQVPQGQFIPGPGSGSGPAIAISQSSPAIAVPGSAVVSTKHGYATGPTATQGDLGYPLYQPGAHPEPTGDVQLRPNRRPLIVGGAIAVVGLIIILAVTLGGSKDPDDHSVTPPGGSGSAEPAAGTAEHGSGAASGSAAIDHAADHAVGAGSSEPAEDFITIHIVSDPAGSEVLVADKRIGTTPYDGKLQRGTKVALLVVRHAGYPDFTSKIDLGGDYSNDQIKLVKETPVGAGSADTHKGSGGAVTGPKNTPDHRNPGNPDHRPSGGTTDHKNPGNTQRNPPDHPKDKTPKAPKCQAPGAYNPFDTSCNGEACPPCK